MGSFKWHGVGRLESSCLAAGQARQVDELAEAVRIFETLACLPEFAIEDPIDAGALVEIELCGESYHMLLVPAAGGMVIEEQGLEITCSGWIASNR